jgi:DNA-binding NarL/FixJ family response regulator
VVVVPGRIARGVRAPDPDAWYGPSVLLIDRQPLFVAALGSLLITPPVGARVQVARDTETGLQIALGGAVDLVFCEIRAEPIAAVDLAQRLSEATPRVPVILLGEQEDDLLMTAALRSTVAGLFTKDVSLDEFLVGVQTVLAGHRAVGSNLMSLVLARVTDGSTQARRTTSQLSPTELDILTMIGEAKSIPVIAASRGISHKTVRNHLANIYRKLDLRSRAEATLCAVRMGLTAT